MIDLEVVQNGQEKRARLQLHLMPAVEGPLVRAPRQSKTWKRHPEGPGGVARLTPRQLALLHWHSRGSTLTEIAAQMHIMASTVRTLVSEIRHLLSTPDLNEAVALAMPRLKAELTMLPLGADRNHEERGPLTPGAMRVLHLRHQCATTSVRHNKGDRYGNRPEHPHHPQLPERNLQTARRPHPEGRRAPCQGTEPSSLKRSFVSTDTFAGSILPGQTH